MTPVLQIQLFELKIIIRFFYVFSVVSIKTNKNFLNLN